MSVRELSRRPKSVAACAANCGGGLGIVAVLVAAGVARAVVTDPGLSVIVERINQTSDGATEGDAATANALMALLGLALAGVLYPTVIGLIVGLPSRLAGVACVMFSTLYGAAGDGGLSWGRSPGIAFSAILVGATYFGVDAIGHWVLFGAWRRRRRLSDARHVEKGEWTIRLLIGIPSLAIVLIVGSFILGVLVWPGFVLGDNSEAFAVRLGLSLLACVWILGAGIAAGLFNRWSGAIAGGLTVAAVCFMRSGSPLSVTIVLRGLCATAIGAASCFAIAGLARYMLRSLVRSK